MKTNYTPGPWEVHRNIGRKSEIGIVADGAPCVIAIMGNQKAWPLEAEANAQLISAAPALAKALAMLREDFRMLRDGEWVPEHDSKDESIQAAIDNADEALLLAGIEPPDEINLDETEIELIEAGSGNADTERETGKRSTDLYQWGVILPGEDEEELKGMIGDMDIGYTLAPAPWTNTVFTGSREDLEVLRRKIVGVV